MTFNIGTPVSIMVDGIRAYGTVTSITPRGNTVFVMLDDGRKGFGRNPANVNHRTISLNGTPAFFDVDGYGDMALWTGTPEDSYPKEIIRQFEANAALWLYLWAQSE